MDLRLDDLYRMTAFIYHDANLGRSREATMLHFVEVCGMLTLIDRKKKRDRVDVPGALVKALGWYFPLMAKMGVPSVEELVFTKFPHVCPYCRRAPHVESICKLVKGTENVLSHEEVLNYKSSNWDSRPAGLNEWQSMFNEIYPRSLNSGGFSTIALMEELGELSEAIRVFDRYPHYFYGEAADIFSYIMGLANEYSLQCSEREETFDFEHAFISHFPGLCIACGGQVCSCPTMPPATVGRMAKEMPIGPMAALDADAFDSSGRMICEKVADNLGRIPGISSYLPYDRGDFNAGLTQLAFRLAFALDSNHGSLADSLRGLAIKLSKNKQPSGASDGSLTGDVLDLLKKAWLLSDPELQKTIESEQPTLGRLAHMLETRILIISANPEGESDQAVRLDKEIAAIQTRIRLSNNRDRIQLKVITAATVDDIRFELLNNRYDIIHFSGHADADGLEVFGDNGLQNLSYYAFDKMISNQTDLKCLVLNTCSAMQGLRESTASLLIAMIDEIDDEEAITFSKGFYDAIASGHSPSEAYDVATTALESNGFNPHKTSKLVRQS